MPQALSRPEPAPNFYKVAARIAVRTSFLLTNCWIPCRRVPARYTVHRLRFSLCVRDLQILVEADKRPCVEQEILAGDGALPHAGRILNHQNVASHQLRNSEAGMGAGMTTE